LITLLKSLNASEVVGVGKSGRSDGKEQRRRWQCE